MAWEGLLLAVALSAGGPNRASAVRFLPDAVVAAHEVRLGEVADLTAVPLALRRHASELVLMRLGPARANVTVSAASLSARARALMPGLAPWLPASVAGAVSLHPLTRKAADPLRNAPPATAHAEVKTGQHIFVHARIGAVEVTREVEALQPGRPGGRLFVRAADGGAFAVRLEDLSS